MILVVGLGSMGQRRIRCLRQLGINEDIIGVDIRQDRRSLAESSGVHRTFASLDGALELGHFRFAIVCLPPLLHNQCVQKLVVCGISVFVEASVDDSSYATLLLLADLHKCRIVPSATLLFHPAVQMIQQIVRSDALGNLSSFQYHSGQYLPDWHPYESVADYYVSIPESGGAREIVPFELVWLTQVFGYPEKVTGTCRKTTTIPGAEKIADTYCAVLAYPSWVGTVVVDVVSREARRCLVVTGDLGTLYWDWQYPLVRIVQKDGTESVTPVQLPAAAEGYHPAISEGMYQSEIRTFIDSIEGHAVFPHSLERDSQILDMLRALEMDWTF